MSSLSDRKRVFVFDSPRCCSHLFRKIFSAHPRLTRIDVPFFAPWQGPESLTHNLKMCQAAQQAKEDLLAKAPLTATLGITFAEAAKRLMEAVSNAEKGISLDSVSGLPKLTLDAERSGKDNVIFIQDHAPFTIKQEIALDVLRNPSTPLAPTTKIVGNPTHIPDELMQTLTPIILIRNPLLSVPSMWQVSNPWTKTEVTDEEFVVLSSQTWARMIFDWFREQGTEPLVIDAGDLIQDPSKTTALICQHIGVDPSGIQQKWEPIPADQQPPDEMMRFYLKDIWSSNGIRPKLHSDDQLDLDTEVAKWEKELGNEVAQGLRQRVEVEIPNYEYLYAHRST